MAKVSQVNPNRLFSNLELVSGRLQHQPGSLWGSVALVAGTTVGAGILALPAVTLPSGILPSTVLLIAVWGFVVVSALLIAEVAINGMRSTGKASNGLRTMVAGTLGEFAAQVTGILYLFLNYALIVAYISQGGDILSAALARILSLEKIPIWVGKTAFVVIFGGMLYSLREKVVEKINSAFVGIVIVSFLGLLLLVRQQINPAQFLLQNWFALPGAVSVMLVALFFHNIIPVVVVQLEGDISKIRQSIVLGSAIPMLMFLVWNGAILASVSPDLWQSQNQFDPLQILRSGNAGEWLGILVSLFSEFAIVTSFIGFVYGLIDYWQDITQEIKNHRFSLQLNRLSTYSIVLLPAIGLSNLNPNLFFVALDYAGTFSISILGGIIPALMAWQQRRNHQQNNYQYNYLVGGGNLTLIILAGIGVSIILI